jgi:hypothetical protein
MCLDLTLSKVRVQQRKDQIKRSQKEQEKAELMNEDTYCSKSFTLKYQLFSFHMNLSNNLFLVSVSLFPFLSQVFISAH